jgi:diguanylate cyclase (GGDEF)-like protein
MSGDRNFWDRPGWAACLAVVLLHFFSARLTFLCAVTPDEEVVVWLPNAVLLAALLRFQGQRGWLLAGLTFLSDLIANPPEHGLLESALLCLVNLVEVVATYVLMRRTWTSPKLERIPDLLKFIVAGPILSTLLAGLLAGVVIKLMEASDAPYLALARLWWFGDSLGMLIYTPLLLAFSHPPDENVRLRPLDGVVLLLTLGLAGLIFSGRRGGFGDLALTPNLLLPSVLFMAARLGKRWTALAVALISLATAYALSNGKGAFADYASVVQAQEFIMILCIVGLGFAVLLGELKVNERELEYKVRERTRELRDFNDRLSALSATDGLTGIANRRHFDEVLAREWQRAKREGVPLTLILLDVDWFKPYNDRYGHQLGDDALRAVANILKTSVHRGGDLVARYGGEEFALIVPATEREGATRVAELVCDAVKAAGLPHELSDFGVITVSLGVAVLAPGEEASLDQLVTQADGALYRAKAAGRNRVVLAWA